MSAWGIKWSLIGTIIDRVDEIYIYIYNLSITLRTLTYGNYCIFLIMGNPGFISSTIGLAMMGIAVLPFGFRALGFSV